jgi:hypothetical protein
VSKLVSSGIKPLDAKKLYLWCDSVRARVDHMLSSSLNTPASAGLVGSEVFTVMTIPAQSTVVGESMSDNDSECGAERGLVEDDASDNDLEILGEQSGTTHATNSTGDASGGTETPPKKAKTKFYEHPEIRAQIEEMKTEFMWYQALDDSIKSFETRKDSKGMDTFDLSDWWKSNCETLPGFTYVLRAVLTNSPNSCPHERVFSIFNVTYNDDQKKSESHRLH